MQHPAPKDARKFLKLWFGEKPDGYMLRWTNPGKRSEWYKDIDRFAKDATSSFDKNNYFGVCLSDKDHGVRARLDRKKRPAKGILGFWSDIDTVGDGHVKKNYPTDQAEALKLVADVPTPPSIITDTGGGIHSYWAFHEPWIFKDADDRAVAQALARQWHHLLLAAAEARGFTMDNVSDLERVMRLPGTFNVKDPKNPKPVTILQESSWRYEPDDFTGFLQNMDKVQVPVVEPQLHPAPTPEPERIASDSEDALKLSLNAQPPIEKLEAMFVNSRRAKQTWEHKRPDFKDQSGSSYDLSMANFCVQAGFSKQETTNTLIAMRRKHHDENLPRKMREGYFTATYERAFATFNKEHKTAKKRETAVASSSSGKPEDQLALFNEFVGTSFTDCTRIKTEGYEVHFKHFEGELVLPTKKLLSFVEFTDAYYNLTMLVLPHIKPAPWKGEALPMLAAWFEQPEKTFDLPEGGERSMMLSWVENYFEETTVVEELTEDAYREGYALKDLDGNHYLRSEELRKYIGRHRDDKIAVHRMSSLLKSAGLRPCKSPKKILGTNKTQRFWVLKARKVIPFPNTSEGSNE